LGCAAGGSTGSTPSGQCLGLWVTALSSGPKFLDAGKFNTVGTSLKFPLQRLDVFKLVRQRFSDLIPAGVRGVGKDVVSEHRIADGI
jgi:hypothetical protein